MPLWRSHPASSCAWLLVSLAELFGKPGARCVQRCDAVVLGLFSAHSDDCPVWRSAAPAFSILLLRRSATPAPGHCSARSVSSPFGRSGKSVLSGALPLWHPLFPSAQSLQRLFPPAIGRSSDRGSTSALTEISRFFFTFTHMLLLLFVSSSLLLCLVLLVLQFLSSSASTLLGWNFHLACKIHTQIQKQTQQKTNVLELPPATR